MTDQSSNDTTHKKHNESSGFNPDIRTVIELVSEHHHMTAQIKKELSKAQNQLKQLQCCKQQAKDLHQKATQLLDEIHTTLWPLLEKDTHE